MTDYKVKVCSKCGQQLRVPKDVGGIVMACPTCGEKFHSDFKLGGVRKSAEKGLVITIFELPSTVLRYLIRFLSSK